MGEKLIILKRVFFRGMFDKIGIDQFHIKEIETQF